MSKFNPAAKPQTVTNLAGGQAHSQSPELELVSILLTSFGNDQFYRKEQGTFDRIKTLIPQCDKMFVAQAAIYARNEFGMRTISHVVAGELAKHIGGQDWAKDFYAAVVRRPDDISEIVSYYFANCAIASTGKKGKKSITGAMKKGLGAALGKFNAHTIAKYRGETKGYKMVDLVNIIHPKPTDKSREGIEGLVKGTLRSSNTWESELTKAGQAAESDEGKLELKKDAWTKLIREKSIGYFALLKNLRNIIDQAPDAVNGAIAMLTDENLIKRSLVLPFRYLVAFEEIKKLPSSDLVRNVMAALAKAIDISLSNVPAFEGSTLIVLDVSSSMRQSYSSLGAKSPHIIGSLFAAALVKKNNCDLITFDGSARYVNLFTADSTITVTNSIPFNGGSTNFNSIFKTANKKYDRIIILSDMQGWVGHHTPAAAYNEYKRRFSASPFIYSFDLQGYGSMQFPERNVFALAGLSEKIFDIMRMLESDNIALINEIKKINFRSEKEAAVSE